MDRYPASRSTPTSSDDYSWSSLIDFITPGNLQDLGNPEYSTLASYLGLLTEYHSGPALKEGNHTKVK